MTNGKVQFEIDGIKRSLYFGMVATEIVQKKNYALADAGQTELSATKAFSYIVYGGLCNQAELLDRPYPSYEEAYELTEKILYLPTEIQDNIYNTWAESKAGKDMLDKLPKEEPIDTLKKKAEKKSVRTGTKSKPLPLEKLD